MSKQLSILFLAAIITASSVCFYIFDLTKVNKTLDKYKEMVYTQQLVIENQMNTMYLFKKRHREDSIMIKTLIEELNNPE